MGYRSKLILTPKHGSKSNIVDGARIMRILRPKSKYRFSYQQIAGINYSFSTIADSNFGQDEIRLV
jgi:hypothetical protein